MARKIEAEGQQFVFPDDATDEEIGKTLDQHFAPPAWGDVFGAVPGAVNRGMVKTVAGIHQLAGDITGNTEWQNTATQVKQTLDQEAQAETPKNMTLFQEGVHSGLVSAAENIPNAILAAATAPLVAPEMTAAGLAGAAASIGTSVMGGVTGLRKYADVRDAGFSGLRAGISALFEMLVEKYTEFLPLKELTKGNILWREARKFVVKELGGEELATILQDANAKLHDQPNMTLGDFIRDLGVTAIATPVGAATQLGAFKAGSMVLPKSPTATSTPTPTPNVPSPSETSSTPPAPPVPPASPAPPKSPGVTSVTDILGVPIEGVTTPPEVPSSPAMVTVYAAVDPAAVQDPSFDGTMIVTTDRGEAELHSAEGSAPVYSAQIPLSKLQEYAAQFRGKLDQVGSLPEGYYIVPLADLSPGIVSSGQGQAQEVTTGKVTGEKQVTPGVTLVVSETLDSKGGEASGKKERQGRKGRRREEVLSTETQPPEAGQTVVPPPPAGPVIPEERTIVGADGHEVSSHMKTRTASGEQTVVFPSPEYHQLHYLGRLVSDSGRSKSTRTKVKKELQISVLAESIATSLGIPLEHVRGIAENYYRSWGKAAKKLNSKTTLAPTLNELREDYYSDRSAEEDNLDDPFYEQARLKVDSELQQTYDQYYGADVSGVTAGEVQVAPALEASPYVQRMKRYLSAWIKLFSPSMKVKIIDWAYPGAGGMTAYKDGVHLLWVGMPASFEKSRPLGLVFDLAHEFGHMLITQHLWSSEFTAVREMMMRDYQALLAKIPNMTVGDFLNEWRGPSSSLTINEIADRVGLKMTDPAQKLIDSYGRGSKLGKNSILRFEEWAAEQFARYVNSHQKIAFPLEVRRMWTDLLAKMKAFYTKVVKKLGSTESYNQFIDQLRTTTSQIPTATEGQSLDPNSGNLKEQALASLAVDDFEYTTKVLNRLPEKPVLNREMVIAEANRQDVRPSEREVIKEVLDTLPDRFDRNLFVYKVQNEVFPLALQILPKTKYNTYNYKHIRWPFNPITGGTFPRDEHDAEVHIWKSPFFVGDNYETAAGYVHFREASPYYWAHTRVVNRLVDGVKVRFVMETQSDLMQDARVKRESDVSYILSLFEQADRNLAKYSRSIVQGKSDLTLLERTADSLRAVRDRVYREIEQADIQDLINLLGTARSPLDISWIQEKLDEYSEKYKVMQGREEAKFKMPAAWYELVLRHEYVEAARQGMEKIRIPDINTLIPLEGFQKFYPSGVHFIQALKGMTHPLFGTLTGNVRINEFTTELKNNNIQFESSTVSPDGNSTVFWIPNMDVYLESVGDYLDAVESNSDAVDIYADAMNAHSGTAGTPIMETNAYPGSMAVVARELSPEYLPAAKSVMQKYRANLIPFFNKNFGAKHIVDEFGQGWWEADVNPELGNKPIIYFQQLVNAEQVAKDVAERGGVPDLPAAYKAVQGLANTFLQLNQLAKILPNVEGLQSYRRLMQAMHNLKNSLMEGPNQQIERWNKVPIKQAELVEDAMKEEEREGTHWTSVETELYPDEKGVMQTVYVHRPNAAFLERMKGLGINDSGIALFLALKNDFLRVLTLMERTVSAHTKSFYADSPLIQAARLKEVENEFARLRMVPYLPDPRFGNYSVQVRAGHDEVVDGRQIKKGELVYWAKFENEREQKAHYKLIAKNYGKDHKVSMFYTDNIVTSMAMMPKTFVESTIAALNANEETALTPEQLQVLRDVQYDFTSTGKFQKYLEKGRKGVGGAEKDLRRVYANYMWRTANAISKLQFQSKLQHAISEVSRDAQLLRQTVGNSNEYDKLIEYMKKNFKYVFTPQSEMQGLRAFVSLWYLSFVPKTALLNFSSLPLITFPYLSARYGEAASTGAMLRAMKNVVQFWRNPDKVDANLKKALTQAKIDGVIDQGFAAMLANVAEGGVTLERLMTRLGTLKSRKGKDFVRTMTWRVMSAGMAPFRVVEQINRLVTLAAMYDLESKKQNAQGFSDSAYEQARDAVDYTQNEFSPWNRPEFMRGNKGVLLIFYSYVQNFAFLMFGGDKAWWRMMLIMAAAAGLQGLPGADNFIDIMNWVLRKWSGQYVDLRNDARELAESIGANPDLVMHGLTQTSFGIGYDVSNSVGLGRIIPGTDALFGVGKFEQRFIQAAGELGGPAGSLFVSMVKALGDDNPSTLLRFDAALPPAIRNLERATKAIEQGAWVNSKGQMLVPDVTAAELIGQVLGFSPTRRTVRQEELRAERDVAEYYTLRRQNLLAIAYDARHSGDLLAWLDAREEIQKYNENVPAKELKIGEKDIATSIKARTKSAREVEQNQAPSKRYQALYAATSQLYGEQ